ncbi:MAG: hypothetical protein ACO3ZG_06695 [Kiritimatiellia bacterium]
MRPIIFILLSVLALSDARAQLKLSAETDFATYQLHEPLKTRVIIENQLAQPIGLNIDADSPRFYLEVRDDYGILLKPRGNATAGGGALLPARGRIVVTNDLARLFEMRRQGNYSFQPCIDLMGKTYRGAKQHVEIVSGREVIRLTGVAPSENALHTYIISHINRNLEDHLLLRIDDEQAGMSYGVYPLGRSVLNTTPQLAVDVRGHAHVLFQAAPAAYAHLTYSPRGALIQSQTYGSDYRTVSLETGPDGTVTVDGQRDGRASSPNTLDDYRNDRENSGRFTPDQPMRY